jgi:hypothetical protein
VQSLRHIVKGKRWENNLHVIICGRHLSIVEKKWLPPLLLAILNRRGLKTKWLPPLLLAILNRKGVGQKKTKWPLTSSNA